MARRPGVIRQAVEGAARALVAQRRALAGPDQVVGVTYLDLEAQLVPTGVARGAVRRTLEQLARDAVMPRVGAVRVPHSRRPLGLYAPVDGKTNHQPALAGLELQALLTSGAWMSASA